MSVEDLIAAVRDAMDDLEMAPIGGIGADGPTLADLDAYARETGGACWNDDAEYHTAQRAWRLLEHGLNMYERNAPDQARLQPSPEAAERSASERVTVRRGLLVAFIQTASAVCRQVNDESNDRVSLCREIIKKLDDEVFEPNTPLERSGRSGDTLGGVVGNSGGKA